MQAYMQATEDSTHCIFIASFILPVEGPWHLNMWLWLQFVKET